MFLFFRCVRQVQQPKSCLGYLMEAAEHASPQGFHASVTVVMERLKRDELKRRNAEPKQ
jgi:hypothetical protein